MCKRLRDPCRKSWRLLVKTVRHIKGSNDLSTFMPRSGKRDRIEAYLDGDCDDTDRKSASGVYLMVGGCRLHSHSRTTGQHAHSSEKAKFMTMSDLLLKVTNSTIYNLLMSLEHFAEKEVLEESSIWTSGTVGCKRN